MPSENINMTSAAEKSTFCLGSLKKNNSHILFAFIVPNKANFYLSIIRQEWEKW